MGNRAREVTVDIKTLNWTEHAQIPEKFMLANITQIYNFAIATIAKYLNIVYLCRKMKYQRLTNILIVNSSASYKLCIFNCSM